MIPKALFAYSIRKRKKPIFIGAAILDFSKMLMFQFHDVVKSKY